MPFWASSIAVLKLNYSEGTRGEALGRHFSGYSFAAAGKRVTRPKAKACSL